MTSQMATSEFLRQFDVSGYVILKGLLDSQAIHAAQEAIGVLVEREAQELIKAGIISESFRDEPFESRMFRLYEKSLDTAPASWRPELHLPGLFDVFFCAPLLDRVEAILGPEIRLYPNYAARIKLPEQRLVLWHQDGGYTEHWHKVSSGDVVELQMVNVWAPLVPARVENGCMQFVAGSHKLGLLPHEQREYYLKIPEEHIAPHAERIIDIELDPGDVVVFQNMLCHRNVPNRTQTVRWSLDWRYQLASQSTLRAEKGYIARSRKEPETAVHSASEWGRLSFC